MSRWKELPEALDQRVRQLVVQMRRLKDRSGLSLVSLAAKTGYSSSSWERYLNGKALPPRDAVAELARATGAEPTRLLVLHEMAEEAWQQRAAPSATTAAQHGSGPEGPDKAASEGPELAEDPPAAVEAGQPPGVRKPVALAAVVAAALAGLAAGMLIAAPWGDDDGGGDGTKRAVDTAAPRPDSDAAALDGPGRYVFKLGESYPCKVRRIGASGGLGAGYSTTRTAVLAGPGWEVVEAQCLLRHHRLNPGTVDGVYGQQTIAAVARLQKKAGLPADGIVGPHTWRVLRR
ncbi:peptidoglycan-binding protein [Streptomyces sparsogenes]|uniref:peptidoglycan-binding protein n=1 Tax=Streptomyces sparsogenes TaxID=67365 RepID=UPI0033DC403F